MRSEKVFVLFLFLSCILGEAMSEPSEMEARGKKKKIALFVFIADLIVKKLFFVKLFYAFVFWILLHKAGYFFSYALTFLKEKKHHHHDHHDHIEHYPHYEGPSYGPSYGPPGYGPYRRGNQGA